MPQERRSSLSRRTWRSTAKLIVFELRQLRRAKHHFVAHQNWWRDFGVIVRLAGVYIEKKLTKRAFKPRQAFLQNDKARARKLRSSLEIHLAERFAEVEMLLGRKRVVALGAETMMLDVVLLVLAVGHFVERQIGNFGERIIQCFFGRLLLQLPSAELNSLSTATSAISVLASGFVLFFFRFADFLRGRVAARLARFRAL